MRALVALTAAITVVVGIGAPAQAAPTARSVGDAKDPGGLFTKNVCHDTKIAKVLTGAQPGDMLADPQNVTDESNSDYGSIYRVLYATEGANNTLEASCGLIAIPEAATLKGVVAWAHGTIGLLQRCQPSERPQNFVGKMPGGIGVPSKGLDQSAGALENILRDGFAVVATDYASQGIGNNGLQHYVLGVPEGLAVLNSARVLTHNPVAFGLSAIDANAQLPLVTWGHSQGGGSAIWAGQLAKQYFELRADHTLNLAGIAAEAPATQYTTSPGQPANLIGAHLGDRDMYNFDPGLGVKIPIGAVLFSYVMASWSQVTNANAGILPFGPTLNVNYEDVLTFAGENTAPKVSANCLSGTDLLNILGETKSYQYPALYKFFAQPFAGGKVNGTWTGAIDTTCNNPGKYKVAVQDWCRWLQFNMPGPYGVNDYAKYPLNNAGAKVPMYLAQGRDDQIMWCVDASGAVSAPNCLTAQYYGSIDDSYCASKNYVNAQYFANVGHMQVPSAAATNPNTGKYQNSPLDNFITGAMNGSLPGTCSVTNSPDPN